MRLYSVYDKVAQQYSSPSTAINDGVAYRQYQDLMSKVPPFAQDDYRLTYIGDFDNTLGLITGSETPIVVSMPEPVAEVSRHA